jgi:hypothetical protein
MHRGMDIPLVGPGNELQLTIDGRAVPHAEVVEASRPSVPAAPGPAPKDDAAGVPPEQTRLTADFETPATT